MPIVVEDMPWFFSYQIFPIFSIFGQCYDIPLDFLYFIFKFTDSFLTNSRQLKYNIFNFFFFIWGPVFQAKLSLIPKDVFFGFLTLALPFRQFNIFFVGIGTQNFGKFYIFAQFYTWFIKNFLRILKNLKTYIKFFSKMTNFFRNLSKINI